MAVEWRRLVLRMGRNRL